MKIVFLKQIYIVIFLVKKEPYIYGGVYCTICGKIGNITIGSKKVVNENLPIFDISDKGLFAKEIDLSGANIS